MTQVRNHLIESLPPRARTRLLALCEPVELLLGQTVCERGTPSRHVYFPTEGFISLTTATDRFPGLEVGMVGSEGMLGVELVLGVAESPWHSLVQGAGAAWRIDAAVFCAELERNPALRRGLQRYIHVLMVQLATSAACQRFHVVGARLARWLLMTQDRAHANRFLMTQVFLAYMLGVRRVGVTTAAGALQRDGLISYHRGQLTVLDRKGLIAQACSCYAADRQIYREVLP